jgi:hypothetical protein
MDFEITLRRGGIRVYGKILLPTFTPMPNEYSSVSLSGFHLPDGNVTPLYTIVSLVANAQRM